MKIITTANIKGGCGKSTTAVALAQAAAASGRKVLFIDLDPQANGSFFIGADQAAGSYQLLHGADPAQTIQRTAQGVDVIAASPDLATETTRPGSAKRLQEAIAPLKKDYDYAYIDTPPQMGELTYNALLASTGMIIPMEADNSSLQGLYQVVDIAQRIQASNPALDILGIVLTRYDNRSKLSRYMKDAITAAGQGMGIPLLAAIRPGVAIREAQALQLSVFGYAPKSNPALDYMDLFTNL